MKDSRTRWAITLALVYFAIFAAQFFWAYVPRYLVSLGWTATAAGGVLSVITLVRSFVMPAWGRAADQVDNSAALLKGLMVLGAVAAVSFPFARSRVELWVVFGVFGVTVMTVTPLLDTFSVREVNPEAFGRIRSVGSFGYALAAVGTAAIGWLSVGATHESLAELSPWVMAAGFGVAALGTMLLPRSTARPRNLPSLDDAKRLFRNKHVRRWVPVWFLHWMTIATYNLFFVMLCEDRGLPAWLPGVAIGGGVLAEVGVLAAGGGVLKRVGPDRLLLATIAVTALRWFGTTYVVDPAVMIGLQLLHGISFGAFLLSAMAVLDRETPDSIRATVQALLYVIVFGVGSAASHAGSGAIVDRYGSATLFLAAGIVELLALLLGGAALMRNRQIEEK
jgi:PPP family 3-phenylpropionic acid transporter